VNARRAVVIGLGRTGLACARTLHAEGYRVLVVDRRDDARLRELAASLPDGVDTRLGGYPDDIAVDAAIVCPSPGVPWNAPELERAREHGVPIRTEMDLVFERCHARMVGITGTNGKTTTTSLVASILERGGNRVHLGGNIGVTMLDRLGDVEDADWVVLELSSFQLETIQEPACAIACVLNVTPDHLDRHGSFETYAETKRKLVRFAIDDVVLGYDDDVTRAMSAAARARVRYFGFSGGLRDGATVVDEQLVAVDDGATGAIMPVSEISLFGRHNVLNVLAAVAVSRAAGVETGAIREAVRDFRAVRHRLQVVAEQRGVLWVNDSKATNAESAVVALRAFESRPIVWIGGGVGAGTDPTSLVDEIVKRARFAVLNGANRDELERALQVRGFDARASVATLADAVTEAKRIAEPGDVVLLAPGFKSFDQFRDFEERGDSFIAMVEELYRVPAEHA
jgi:UDP-N-acetylmuramoylalanine--D-glutamate ligase